MSDVQSDIPKSGGDGGKDLAQIRTEWAEDRTDWAEDRTILANERTFAGWVRTALACLVVALALEAIFGNVEPRWLPKLVANLFVVAAVVVLYLAWRYSCKTIDRLDQHAATPLPRRQIGVIAGVVGAGAVSLGVILWLA